MKPGSVIGLVLAVAMIGLVCSAIRGGQDACRLTGGRPRGMECEVGK